MFLDLYTLKSRNGLDPTLKNKLMHDAFRLRYVVYHDEMRVIPENKEMELYDNFDFIEPSYIFLAKNNERAVGTMGLTNYTGEYGLPILSDHEEVEPRLRVFYEDIKKAASNGKKIAQATRFTIPKEYRGKGLSFIPAVLTCMMHDQCDRDGVTDIVMVANPERVKLYKAAGFKIVENKKDYLTKIESPIMMAEVNDGFGKFVKRLKSILNGRELVNIGANDHLEQEVVNL